MSKRNLSSAVGRVQQVSSQQTAADTEKLRRLEEREQRAEASEKATRTFAPNQPANEPQAPAQPAKRPLARHAVSMPAEEDDALEEVQKRVMFAIGKPVNTSEVFRMALQYMSAADDETLKERYYRLDRLKPGPSKSKGS